MYILETLNSEIEADNLFTFGLQDKLYSKQIFKRIQGRIQLFGPYSQIYENFSHYHLQSQELTKKLKEQGFYGPQLMANGDKTLIGVTRFSLEYLRTVNLNDGYAIDAVNAGLQSQAYSNKVTPATQSVLNVITKKEKAFKVAAKCLSIGKNI